MTKASELLALAGRCEAATGANSEISAAIHNLRGFREWDTYCPHYTASIDAAMTLVPERWGKVCRDDDDRGAFARVYSPDFDGMTFGKGGDWITTITAGQQATAYGATWPLALCAAALRSIASKESDDG